jgi:hypothetical protein
MRAVSLAVACVLGGSACGAAQPQTTKDYYEERFGRTVRGSQRFAAAAAANDEAAITALLASDVTLGGVWFSDAACRQQFGGVGEVSSQRGPAFAHCLATLGLTPAKLGTTHPDVVAYTYGPGVLLETRFDPDDDGRLKYVGYAGRRTEREALPVVTGTALLEHRTDTTAFAFDATTRTEIVRELVNALAVDPSKITDKVIDSLGAWVRVCIDAGGAVTSTTLRDAKSIVAGEAVAAWARTWTFRPIVLGEQAMPVCGIVFFSGAAPSELKRMPMPVPATEASAIMVQPFSKLRRSGLPMVIPSDDDKTLARHRSMRTMTGVVGFCIDAAGSVTSSWTVLPSTLPNYDLRLRRAASETKYAPYLVRGRGRPVCTIQTFRYRQR